MPEHHHFDGPPAVGDQVSGGLPQLAVPADEGVPLGVEMAVTTAGQRRRLARAGVLVAPATLLANVLGYAFNVVMARGLGVADYGALGALLGLSLIGAVPALAAQAVVARRVAVATADDGRTRELLRVAVLLALATGAVLALLSPALTAYLRLPGLAPALWLAASLVPLVLVSALQGVLQGREQFGRLSTLFIAAAALRLLGAALSLTVDGSIAGVLAGTAAGSAVAAGLGWALVRTTHVPAQRSARSREPVLRELAGAALGLLSLVVLANIDVLLARRHLPAREAGLYAVGAVFAKAAFWAPQAVVVLVFPRLSASADPRVLRTALAAVGGSGLVLVLGAALLADPVVPLVFGDDFAVVARYAWAFTALGATLAVAQLLIFRGIAAMSTWLAVAAAGVAVVESLAISLFLHDSIGQVVGASLGAAVLLVLVGFLPALRRPGRSARR